MTSVITFNKRKGKKKKKGKIRTSISALGTSNSNDTKRNNNVDIQKKTIERMIEKQQQEVGLKSKKDEEFERSLAEYETEIAKEDFVLQKVFAQWHLEHSHSVYVLILDNKGGRKKSRHQRWNW